MVKINNHYYSENEISEFLTFLGYQIVVDKDNKKHAVKSKSLPLNTTTLALVVINKYKNILNTKPSLKRLYLTNN